MRVVYSEVQIAEAVARIAATIDRDYAGQDLHLLGVLKGSVVFLGDLMRRLQTPCTVDFVRLSSYGAGTSSGGSVEERISRRDPLRGRHVLVVEEIVDSGRTLATLLADLETDKPASLRVCTLVDKTGRREVEVPVHYRGLVLDDGFLVGYGLDLDERYRNLPAIYEYEGGAT
ncbi:MAG: hypoxanthine phosphoribosyltransferase [Deltaproteobacteria bacterium]|nr:hypoxanthine phosphoribosyltransferase [Deltaproteobacteria bacterium]